MEVSAIQDVVTALEGKEVDYNISQALGQAVLTQVDQLFESILKQ